MFTKKFIQSALSLSLGVFAFAPLSAFAQNPYGGSGFNQYNQSGIGTNYGQSGGYGGSSYGGGGYGGSSYGGGGYGGSSYGGGGNSGGFGSSQFGGGNSGGFGSSQFGGGNSGGFGSSRSGRSSRSSRNSSYGNQAYGNNNTNQGYSNSRSSRGRGRSNSQNNNANNPYGGQFQNQSADPNNPGQTQSSRTAPERLGNAAGAASGVAPQGGIQIQGTTGGDPDQPGKGKPQLKSRNAKSTETQFRTRDSAMLYLKPSRTISAPNQPVTVDVMLANPARVEYDDLSLQLRFDPSNVKVVQPETSDEWTDATELRIVPSEEEQIKLDESNNLSGKKMKFIIDPENNKYEVAENRIDASKGIIDFKVKTIGKSGSDNGILARFTVVPQMGYDMAKIGFQFSEVSKNKVSTENGVLTYLRLEGKDQLGSSYDPADGVINLEVSVLNSDADPAAKNHITRADRERRFDDDEGASGSLQLHLISQETTVDVGDTVEVAIFLDNPENEEFDAVSLLIAFNPRILEPIDGDEIASGVNLDETEGKARFTFDFPLLNTIDSDKGLIDFRKRNLNKALSQQGVVATVRFRAIRPTNKTTFRILVNAKGEDPTTGVFFRGQDRLGAPADPYDGFTTTSISVRPTLAYLNKLRKSSDNG